MLRNGFVICAGLEGPMVAAPLGSRRERARAATIEEIKSTALALMREQGTTDVRFTDIARVMGMTAPALYRYYGDRDELLTELIADAYVELGTAIGEALAELAPDDIGGRWLAAAGVYRDWARREPQQFALVLGLPVPGYVAPDEGPTTEAAKRAMSQLASLFVAAAHNGELRTPLVRDTTPGLAGCMADKHPELEGIVPPENFQAMLQAWASLHGFTSLEAYGHFDWLTDVDRDALFRSHVRMIAVASGIPAPPA
jgi:AcrR family transcriptional regulator